MENIWLDIKFDLVGIRLYFLFLVRESEQAPLKFLQVGFCKKLPQENNHDCSRHLFHNHCFWKYSKSFIYRTNWCSIQNLYGYWKLKMDFWKNVLLIHDTRLILVRRFQSRTKIKEIRLALCSEQASTERILGQQYLKQFSLDFWELKLQLPICFSNFRQWRVLIKGNDWGAQESWKLQLGLVVPIERNRWLAPVWLYRLSAARVQLPG